MSDDVFGLFLRHSHVFHQARYGGLIGAGDAAVGSRLEVTDVDGLDESAAKEAMQGCPVNAIESVTE